MREEKHNPMFQIKSSFKDGRLVTDDYYDNGLIY